MKPDPPRRSNRPRWAGTVASVAMVLVASGCGDGLPKRVPISGKVLVDGEPIPAGEVMFVPDGMRPSASKIDSDGRFSLECFDGGDGAVLGTHRVQVFACQYDTRGPNWYAPKKYADFRTSGITHEVTQADDSVVIELTWEGEKRPKKR